jgi:hypothetical protein
MFQRNTFGLTAAAAVLCFRTCRFHPLMAKSFAFRFIAFSTGFWFNACRVRPLMFVAAACKKRGKYHYH